MTRSTPCDATGGPAQIPFTAACLRPIGLRQFGGGEASKPTMLGWAVGWPVPLARFGARLMLPLGEPPGYPGTACETLEMWQRE
jgi:hypothetical protein